MQNGLKQIVIDLQKHAIFEHAGNPKLIKIDGLIITKVPACEGGGFALTGEVATLLKKLMTTKI